MNEQLFKTVLGLGDDALIMGHRLSEWSSKAPLLEEDLALSNLALDYIGRAESLLRYAAELEGQGRHEDDLAYKREERAFYNHLLCETENGDFAQTMVRQFLFSAYEYLLYKALCNSKDQTLAAIAEKAIKEIKYHLRHAETWCIRLGDGTEESKLRMQEALNHLWMYTGELFENESQVLIDAGLIPSANDLQSAWLTSVQATVREAGLRLPEASYMQTGGKQGIHTEQLGYILAEMQFLQRAYPDGVW